MYNAIKKFLALHHHLSLPGIGNFRVERQPAEINIANRSILSSKNKIVFNNEKLPAEKKFYNFLSQEFHIDEVQAIRSFTGFTARLQNDLNEKNSVYFKGIGTLTRQTAHVLIFQPEETPDYLPELPAERIVRKNTMHTVRVGEQEKTSEEMQTALYQPQKIKKEKWWVAAAILAVIGITAIVFYYTMYR